jgi:DNA-binding transcriptional regulator LsrR (DeoR family)
MANSTDERALLLQVSRLYYEQNQTQEQIADALKLSRPKVARLLQRARELGIVQITIRDPFASDHALERELIGAFGLHAAIVVPASATENERVVSRRLGQATARYLAQTIKGGDIVGVGWGRTLHQVVNSLTPAPLKNPPHVLPLVGGLGQVAPSFQVNELAQQLATAFGGTWDCLYAPAVLESQNTLTALTAQADVRRVVEQWKKVTLALVGVGNLDLHSEVQMLFVDYLQPRDQKRLLDSGAVGDLCMRFFDRSGHPCPPAVPAILGIELRQIKAIDRVIAVAGGANKTNALLGALRGGYIKMLVTDAIAARGIIERAARNEKRDAKTRTRRQSARGTRH